MSLDAAINAINNFQGNSLTEQLASIESQIQGFDLSNCESLCLDHDIDDHFIQSALDIKKLAGQINVIIHAAGILKSLPNILKENEIVDYVSLGAGNTGRKFDLETNLRVAEYKFIDWKGGPESIRQNGIFKDFYELAEFPTDKEKILYVVGTTYPLKFFNGSRALTSVLSRQPKILNNIKEKYGSDVKEVNDYFSIHKSTVQIKDVSPFIGR